MAVIVKSVSVDACTSIRSINVEVCSPAMPVERTISIHLSALLYECLDSPACSDLWPQHNLRKAVGQMDVFLQRLREARDEPNLHRLLSSKSDVIARIVRPQPPT